ncbi:MAG: hypothetical protein AB7F53_04875 [Nitrososphaeraceae archaeon]
MPEENPPNVGNLEGEYSSIIKNMMKELCDRQRNSESAELIQNEIDDIWQRCFEFFNSRDDLMAFLRRFQEKRRYIEIISDKYIHLTKRGLQYCENLE